MPLVSISMTAARKILIGMHQYSHFTITLLNIKMYSSPVPSRTFFTITLVISIF
jgi:hypothetical protein